MTTLLRYFRRATRRSSRSDTIAETPPIAERMSAVPTQAIAIAPNDPLVAYFLSVPGAVELERLRLDSPALEAMRAAGVKVVVSLVSQGELIGVISMGPRLSQQEYSSDDRALLLLIRRTPPPSRGSGRSAGGSGGAHDGHTRATGHRTTGK